MHSDDSGGGSDDVDDDDVDDDDDLFQAVGRMERTRGKEGV